MGMGTGRCFLLHVRRREVAMEGRNCARLPTGMVLLCMWIWVEGMDGV